MTNIWRRLLPLAVEAAVIGVILLGFLTPDRAPLLAALVLVAGFAALAALKPQAALVLLVAVPPGAVARTLSLAGVTVPWLVLVSILGVGVALVRRRTPRGAFPVGYGALLLVMAGSVLVGRVPQVPGLWLQFLPFVYYLALFLLVVNLAPEQPDERTRYARRLHGAIVVSVVATGVIGLWQMGPGYLLSPSVSVFMEDAGLLYTRTHFGYVMALGAAITLPRWAVYRKGLAGSVLAVGVALVLVAYSLTRGAWLAVALIALALVFAAPRSRTLLLVPAAAALSFMPALRERLSAEFAGGLQLAIQSGTAGTHRVLLWGVLFGLALDSPWIGRGFGYLTSLSATLAFGEGQFVTAENPFLYAHNDFLYLFLELGLLGVGLYVLALAGWWRDLARSVRAHLKSGDPLRLALLLECVAVALVVLVAQMADNGFFIRALFERFAVILATAVVLSSATSTPDATEEVSHA